MTTLTPAYALLALGVLINLASLAAGLLHLIRLRFPSVRREATTTVILPLTGPVPGLERLLARLAAQSLPLRRLIITVESRADPAHARAVALVGSSPFPLEIVVAGECTHQAQKCHNLIAALALVDTADEAVVLMDGDIEPPPWWLSALVSPLVTGYADIVTGYRWQTVAEPRLGAHLVALIDRSLTLLPRLDAAWSTVIWGGSVALSPRAAAVMDLPATLSNTLSDDLSLADAAGRHGLRVLTRGVLLLPSPNRQGLASAWRFGRRQYQIALLYRPYLWAFSTAVIATRLAAWLVVLSGACGITASLAAGGIMLAAALAKIAVVEVIGARLGFTERPGIVLQRVLIGAAQPLVDLYHLSMTLAALDTRIVTWGHVTYDIEAPLSIRIARRERWPSNGPLATPAAAGDTDRGPDA